MSDTSFITNVNKVAKDLEVIKKTAGLFNKEVVYILKEVSKLNVQLITEDLLKSNYLGNRKLDINLNLNNNSTTEHIAYSRADILLNDGTLLEIQFLSKANTILEYTSHSDIKEYISSSSLYTKNVENTEITVEDAIGDKPQLIRLRDADGRASNIDRITLKVFSGTAQSSSPIYYWAKTTSSLQTLANQIGTIVSLGHHIEKIIALADKEDEIQYLYDNKIVLEELNNSLEMLNTLHLNLNNINNVNNNADNIKSILDIEENILTVVSNADNISNIANNISEVLASLDNAEASENNLKLSSDILKEVKGIRGELANLDAGIVLLDESSNPFCTYDKETGELIIGVPRGKKGDKGEAFTVNASGSMSERSKHDKDNRGFSYLALDESPTNIYFKKTDGDGDWTEAVPFGKGDKGEKGDKGNSIVNIIRTSGDGSTGTSDTYTINFSDNTQTTFDVYNGADPVGFNNVDNTSDENKPISLATKEALNTKLNIVDSDETLAIFGTLILEQTTRLQKIKIQGLNL